MLFMKTLAERPYARISDRRHAAMSMPGVIVSDSKRLQTNMDCRSGTALCGQARLPHSTWRAVGDQVAALSQRVKRRPAAMKAIQVEYDDLLFLRIQPRRCSPAFRFIRSRRFKCLRQVQDLGGWPKRVSRLQMDVEAQYAHRSRSMPFATWMGLRLLDESDRSRSSAEQ
jgi:hypothetical protein